MSPAAQGLLYYLGRYLEAERKSVQNLQALHLKLAQVALDKAALWRHTTLRREPKLSTAIVYLSFLFREQAIVPDPAGKQFFLYARPELLKETRASHSHAPAAVKGARKEGF